MNTDINKVQEIAHFAFKGEQWAMDLWEENELEYKQTIQEYIEERRLNETSRCGTISETTC